MEAPTWTAKYVKQQPGATTSSQTGYSVIYFWGPGMVHARASKGYQIGTRVYAQNIKLHGALGLLS